MTDRDAPDGVSPGRDGAMSDRQTTVADVEVRAGGRATDPGPTNSSPADVVARIRAMLPGMTPAEARIGRILQADAAAASSLTVNELADRASASTATVVRTARRLGFDGYPQLRLAVAAHGGSTPPDA